MNTMYEYLLFISLYSVFDILMILFNDSIYIFQSQAF